MEINEFNDRKNVHQLHFEDLVLLGQDGLEELNDKIEKFIGELNGTQGQLNTTTKIDGAPAVICWSKFPGYPDNSICLKSFVTSNKNALSSADEIKAKYGDRPDMAEKLLYCLQLAHCIPENEAWQGDCLYSKADLKEREIKGTNYLTFHPNKIIYAFSEDNPTYDTIKNSDFGICFHTIYKPAGEGKKTQSFRVDASRLQGVPENIYVMSPALNKSSDKADYNIKDVLGQYDELKKIESQLLSNSDYEDLCDNSVFMSYWNTFENANLSDKRAVNIDVETFFDELVTYIKDKQQKAYDKKMSTLKTDAGKQKATDKYNADVIEIEDILQSNKDVIILLVKALNTAANIKMNLWNGFKKSEQGYNTFYKSKSQGYIPADMEGVALSDNDGNIVKVVDRSTFSFANRSDDIESGFEHNESLEENKDPAWVKNTVNKVQNSDKDPAVIATKAYHAKKKGKKPMKGAVISSTPGLVGAIGESLNEDFNRTAVIAFGRMNPPTIGHGKLVYTMSQLEGDPKLYLSHTCDSKKNPLPYDQKLSYVDKAFGERVEVVNSQAKTVIQALQELYDEGYENIIYVGGEDRIGGEEDITKTIERYNGQPDKQGNLLYDFDNIEFVNAGARNSGSSDLTEVASASMARELARKGDLETFKKIVPFEDETATDLYTDVRLGLGIKEELMTEATTKAADRKHLNTLDDAVNYFKANGGLKNYQMTSSDLKYIYSKSNANPIIGDYGKTGSIAFTHEIERVPDEKLKNIIAKARANNTKFVNKDYHSGMKTIPQGNVEFLIAEAYNNYKDKSLPYHHVAEVLVKNIGNKFKLSKLETKDGAQVTQEWINAGVYSGAKPDRTPKTDLISTKNVFKMSLKKHGGSQLMSGKFGLNDSEALATLNTVIDALDKEYTLDSILNVSPKDDNIKGTFNVNEVLKSFYEDEELYNKSIVVSNIKNRTQGTKKELEQTKKINDISDKLKRFANKLQTICDNDQKFREAFLREAATGEFKFGKDSVSTANCWLVYDDSSADFYTSWKDFYNRYLKTHKVQILVNFKSGGSGVTAPYIVIRILEK